MRTIFPSLHTIDLGAGQKGIICFKLSYSCTRIVGKRVEEDIKREVQFMEKVLDRI